MREADLRLDLDLRADLRGLRADLRGLRADLRGLRADLRGLRGMWGLLLCVGHTFFFLRGRGVRRTKKRKGLHMAAATMVRAGTAIGTLRACLLRFSRAECERAREAYTTLIGIAARGEGRACGSPRDHVEWLCRFDSEVAHIDTLAFCARSRMADVIEASEGAGYEGVDARRDWDAFDPAKHLIFSRDLSLLSYLDEADLGPGGRLVASHFKAAVAWWERSATRTNA